MTEGWGGPGALPDKHAVPAVPGEIRDHCRSDIRSRLRSSYALWSNPSAVHRLGSRARVPGRRTRVRPLHRARTYEVDLGVYLRLGGRYVFTSHLYSFVLPNTSLLFTYPPFAALLFAPWQRTFSTVDSVQTVWTAVQPGRARRRARPLGTARQARSEQRRPSGGSPWCSASPRSLLNPVLVTIGFGQVNLVVTFLVMWDLLSARRIGRWQLPLGVATGLAAAVKLTPLLFVPYLLLTRRSRGALDVRRSRSSPASS